MCEVTSYQPPSRADVFAPIGKPFPVCASGEDAFARAGFAVYPFPGEDCVYILPDDVDHEGEGDRLYCRHPEADGFGEWEELVWPKEGESVRVPVGAELRYDATPTGVHLGGMV